ncbi:MAG: peptide chain release factor 2 [Deltaproteobacteria bacterium]|nr:peptide chain release factor 2 [Deltaproteobacteria bacterium]
MVELEERVLDAEGRLAKVRQKISDIRGHLDLEATKRKLNELDELSSQGDFWNDRDKAQAVLRDRSKVREELDTWAKADSALDDAAVYGEMAREGEAEAVAELEQRVDFLEGWVRDRELERMLSGPEDHRNAIVAIHAGAGGTEAQDWAEMLLRMHKRWAERRGFESEVVDLLMADDAGIKSATLILRGGHAYGYMRAERGVHRLVRISPFDAAKRRHTSFCSVGVSPEIDDDVEVEINKADLKEDTYRASGAGGQHVNRTDSAVRITHLPTGIVVQCQNERSQHKNRHTAMKLLRSQLLELELEAREKHLENLSGSKKKIEWGSQIRSYVLQPYQMVKDHRTGVESGNPTAVLDGDLDRFIEGYLMGEGASDGSSDGIDV